MSRPFPWLAEAWVKRLVAVLGWPDVEVRFVGGCVRDALIGRPFVEFDLGTSEMPDHVIARLERAGVKVVPTGLDHGTVTAVVDATHFEITTLRRDTACDGRHAAVEFTTDWREDAGRRDFTFNAMSLSPDGTLFDYFDGQADLDAGRVRFVGAPADRIKEDYLRILRLFRFHAHYGRAPLDAATLDACATLKDGLRRLSAERVRQELAKLLAAPDPSASVAAMNACGVLEVIVPEVRAIAPLQILVALEQAWGVAPRWTRRLTAMLGAGADSAVLSERLRLTNAERQDVTEMSQPLPRDGYDLALYRQGRDRLIDRTLAAAARDGQDWTDLMRRAQSYKHIPMPVGGADMLARGLRGPAVGEALRRAESLWVESAFTASRDRLLSA